MSAPETCPLCGAPRPRDVTRCRCNYVFEYDRVSGGDSRRGKALVPVLLAVAATGYVLGLFGLRTQPHLAGHSGAGVVMTLAGVFAIIGALVDASWFFRARRARLVVAIASRTGARVLYAALGGALTGAATALLLA